MIQVKNLVMERRIYLNSSSHLLFKLKVHIAHTADILCTNKYCRNINAISVSTSPANLKATLTTYI